MVTGPAASPLGVESETLDIRLLGGFQLRVGGLPLDELRSGRARSLLAFLILHPDVAHARPRLAFEFWPDSSEGQARTNLRNVLHTLRQTHPVIDASLRATPTTLQWHPAEPTTVDVGRFTAAADAAVAAHPDGSDDLSARCRRAMEAYGGDLLEGDYDDWILPRREALRDRYRDVLRLLVTTLIDEGNAGEATSVARELVRVDPLDEGGHRLRIEAHRAANDRAGAVRAYHECVATLERELGVEPGPATAAAYAALLESPPGTATLQPQPTVRARPGLVGRDDEWQRLVQTWHAVEPGQPTVVLVTGEPGIGKTRLVEELRAWCARSGAAVGEARSYASEGEIGCGVVTSWLRSPDIRTGLQGLPAGQRAELSRLLPELGTPWPVDGADDAERRRRLFDAAVAAIAGTGGPTLLLADDCQWSDHVSQEFIHYLVRQGVEGPLLVVLTARREEIDSGHPMTALRDSLAVLDRLTELPLERLSLEATGEIGSQLAGSRLDENAIQALFADTEGNPLFIVETMRAGWARAGSSTLSPRLRAVIDSRFHRLSEVAGAVLGAAAVVGRPSSAGLLARLCDLDDRSLARGLDELWRRGILRESGTDCYEFTHGKLRDAAYENLSPATRRTHHGVVASLLAELMGNDPDVASSQVALHFEAAGRPDDAVVWFQRAALDAQQVFAYGEAIRLLDRALALVPALPADVRHVRELELLSTLPVSLAVIDGFATDRMDRAHRRALAVAADLGVDLEPSMLRSMVMSALCRDEFDDAANAATQLLDHAGATGDASLRVESHYLLGISAFWAARLDDARRHFETVVADFDTSTRTRHHEVYGHDPQVVCLSRLANTLWFLGRDEDARRTCQDALALAVEAGHPWSRATAVTFSCRLAIDSGDHDQLRALVQQHGTLGIDSLPFALDHEALLGLLDAIEERHAEGIARVRGALDRCRGRNLYPGFQAAIARTLLAAHSVAGDAEGGLETCARILDLESTPLWEPEAHRARAEFLHARSAETARVGSALRAAEALARRHGAHGHLHRIDATRRHLGLAASPT